MSQDKSAVYPASASKVRKGGPFLLGNQGFSLIELFGVMAIIAILASLSLPAYSKIKDMVRQVRAMEEIRGLEKALSAYAVDHNGAYPDTFLQAGLGTPLDPWGRQYVYHPARDADARTYLGARINDDYDLYSPGVDGQTDPDIANPLSMDDILRTGDGGYVGVANTLVLGD